MTALKTITPDKAAALVRQGATLVDIREIDEHKRERIPGARHHPLSKLGEGSPAQPTDRVVIFHCRSGMRTQSNASKLGAATPCEAYMLEGGLDAWKKAGLPVTGDHGQPIEIIRQVQIAAGSLVLLGVVLGMLVTPWFYALSAFVGAGLVFAGVSGTCAMATLLGLMPWNKRAQRPSPTAS